MYLCMHEQDLPGLTPVNIVLRQDRTCCAGRFADKAASVRKAALQLAGVLLAFNPFGAFLGLEQLEASLAQHRALLQVRSFQPNGLPIAAPA